MVLFYIVIFPLNCIKIFRWFCSPVKYLSLQCGPLNEKVGHPWLKRSRHVAKLFVTTNTSLKILFCNAFYKCNLHQAYTTARSKPESRGPNVSICFFVFNVLAFYILSVILLIPSNSCGMLKLLIQKQASMIVLCLSPLPMFNK